jgi:hypothetical protein
VKELALEIDKGYLHKTIFEMHLFKFENTENEVEFEELDTYHKLHVYKHLAHAPPLTKIFGVLDSLFSVKNIYKQIIYHKSYVRYRQQLLYFVGSNP